MGVIWFRNQQISKFCKRKTKTQNQDIRDRDSMNKSFGLKSI